MKQPILHPDGSKNWTILLLGLALLPILAACGGTPTAAPTATTAPLVVTDALGRTVTLGGPPERIVIAGKSSLTLVDTLYLFPDAGERLTGLVVGRQPVGEFISLLDPAWGAKTTLAPDAGAEQIAPLRPDAVLLRSFMAEKLGRSLEELGLPVVYLDLETPEQYFRDVAILGKLLGDEERAAAIADFYQSRLDRIAGATADLRDEDRPRVLLVQYGDKGGEIALNVPSASWLQTTEVELAGGAPVWKEAAQGGGWTVVNFEQIAAWDPELIFLVSYKTDSAQVAARLKADPQWQSLGAVQAGRLYGFPADIFSWDQPDPRWLLGVTWLAGRTHPDRFPDLDMVQEVSRFFQEMYGMEETAVAEQILPRLRGDVE